MTTVLTAVLAYCCTFFATVTVHTYICTVAADTAVVTPTCFNTAILADLAAYLTDYGTVSARLAAFFANIRTFRTAVLFFTDESAVAADVAFIAPAVRADAEIAFFALGTYIRAFAAVLAAVLANNGTAFASVVILADVSAVAADVAILAPQHIFSCAFFAQLAAIYAHYGTVSACLAAFIADIGTFGTAVLFFTDVSTVTADVAFIAPAV